MQKMVITPDHYYDGGKIPVFRPTMDQFKDFSTFVESIASYGHVAGLVKVIPPKEWSAALPDLSERLSSVQISRPIIQHIRGNKGIYTQTNIESRKTYNVHEFKALCETSDHRPPSRTGAPHGPADPLPRRKRNRKPAATLQTDAVPTTDTESMPSTPTSSSHPSCLGDDTSPGAPIAANSHNTSLLATSTDATDGWVPMASAAASLQSSANNSPDQASKAYMTPQLAQQHFLRRQTSPTPPAKNAGRPTAFDSIPPEPTTVTAAATVAKEGKETKDAKTKDVEMEPVPPMTDYKVEHGEDFTVEYCKEVERNYWRNLTFVQPMYGADMSGSLFDERTTSWNTAHLGDLLTKIDQQLPGVNTPYLYFGMWKATFAWHVEDMDLYSINYLHFGAPKQWYCIPPEYSERFERIAQGIFTQDFKSCPQFLRHKTHLISPSTLSNDGVPFSRLVQHEGEFVLTFPYAYHSGYNLGFNCAESINFALEQWIDIGRKAESCKCITDSVQIDVEAIFHQSEAGQDSVMKDAKNEDVEMKLASPLTGSTTLVPPKKRNRPLSLKMESKHESPATVLAAKGARKSATTTIPSDTKDSTDAPKSPTRKRIRITSSSTSTLVKDVPPLPPPKPDCMLCPNQDFEGDLLRTSNGLHAHILCCQYVPETYLEGENDGDMTINVNELHPLRHNKLKCIVCQKKLGACVQCCKGKCAKAIHTTCAQKEGMYMEEVPNGEAGALLAEQSGNKGNSESSGTNANITPLSVSFNIYCPQHDPRPALEKEKEQEIWKKKMTQKLKVGLKIKARWIDNMYYGGTIEQVSNGPRPMCRVQFDDGYTKTVAWKDISLDK